MSVFVSECWGRDGIQSEMPIATESKLAVLAAAGQYGARRVELTSFARPDAWAQFADASEVVSRYERHPGVEYSVYIPNVRGYERLAAITNYRDRVDTVLVAVAATDSYNRKNVRRDTSQVLEDIAEIMSLANADGFKVIGCVGTAWWCPVEGPVSPTRIVELAQRLAASGANEIMLGDTTGEANPRSVATHVGSVRAALELPVIGHFHDMRGTAMVNAVAAIDAGVEWIDSALGGVGGHPVDEHQRAVAGNLCTEDFAALASFSGLAAGLDLEKALVAGRVAEVALGRRLLSRVQQSGPPQFLEVAASPANLVSSQAVE